MQKQVVQYQIEVEHFKTENDQLKKEVMSVKEWKKDVAKTLRQND